MFKAQLQSWVKAIFSRECLISNLKVAMKRITTKEKKYDEAESYDERESNII